MSARRRSARNWPSSGWRRDRRSSGAQVRVAGSLDQATTQDWGDRANPAALTAANPSPLVRRNSLWRGLHPLLTALGLTSRRDRSPKRLRLEVELGSGNRRNLARGGRRFCRVLASNLGREIFGRLRKYPRFRAGCGPSHFRSAILE